MHRPLTIVAAALSMLPAALCAQRVHGTLHDSASTLPLTGAVVAVVDSSGAVSARAIANASGGFSLPLTRRSASLHVIRIGYRPRDVALPADRSGDVLLTFSLSRIPPMLATVKVSDAELCPGSTDRGAAFQLWEQARAGLLATVVARETNPADMVTLSYQRYMRPHDDLITRQLLSSRGGRALRPFKSAAKPEDFATHGYVDEDSMTVRTYNAPDEEVLLDESFAATHCFHLQPSDSAHAGQIGLAFTPVAGRDTIVDVAGVVWMDAAKPALRALDFRYTNLEPAAMDAGSGGRVEFESSGSGISFIDWWNLRFPLLSRTVTPGSVDLHSVDARRRRARSDYHVDQMVESGGQVLRAHWKDGTAWEAPASGIAGTISQHGSNAPVPFAVVSLVGTADTVMADAQGRFELSPVPAGRYTLAIGDTTLSSYLPVRQENQVVTVSRDGLTAITTQLGSSANLVQTLCKDQHPRGTPSVILGHLDARGLHGLEVRASWNALVGQSGSGVSVANLGEGSTVDDQGHFVICTAGRGQAVQLRVVRDGVPTDTTIVTNESLLTRVDWKLPAASKPPEITDRGGPIDATSGSSVAEARALPRYFGRLIRGDRIRCPTIPIRTTAATCTANTASPRAT